MHSDIHAFEWDPFNSNKLIVGCDGGMFRSLDGGLNYSAINKGFNATQPYAIGFERYPALGVSGFPMGGVACGNQDNGTTYNLPHRIVLTTKANLQIGVENEAALKELDVFNDKKSKKNFIDAMFLMDSKVVENYMIQVAY